MKTPGMSWVALAGTNSMTQSGLHSEILFRGAVSIGSHRQGKFCGATLFIFHPLECCRGIDHRSWGGTLVDAAAVRISSDEVRIAVRFLASPTAFVAIFVRR